MYESQFQLKRRPFAATPDPRCFLAAGRVQGAMDELVVCVEHGQGIAIVSAPAGTGKTLLCERLRLELDDRFEMVILRHASFLTRRALLQTILCALNHSYRRHDEQELRLELVPAIRSLKPRREALVLVCDEAHLLTEDLLEELRILSDLAENGRPLVRLVLVGQPTLEETLARSSMEALNQRIRAHICLEPFDRLTSLDYIDYRITWGGGRTDEIFTPEALDVISHVSEGVPRCINQLCDHTLLLAYVAEEMPVSVDTVRDALQDLRQLPLHWNESLVSDSSDGERADSEDEPENQVRTQVAADPASEMQSIEIGADIPFPSNQERQTDLNAPVDSVVSVEVDESPIEEQSRWDEFEDSGASVECEEVLQVHEPTEQTIISESPLVDVIARSVVTQTLVSPPRVKVRSTELVDEIVWDKYAAIDGGFTLPDLPAQQPFHEVEESFTEETVVTDVSEPEASIPIAAEQTRTQSADESAFVGPIDANPVEEHLENSVSEVGNGNPDTQCDNQVRIEDVITAESHIAEGENSSLSEEISAVTEARASESDEVSARVDTDENEDVSESFGGSDEFDAACERLEGWLPEIHEESAWGTDEDADIGYVAGGMVLLIENRVKPSLEVQLGLEVSEMVQDIRAEISTHQEDDTTTQRKLSEVLELVVTQEELLSSGFEPTPDTTPTPAQAETAAKIEKPSTSDARPFRNLFSMLRRKQRGL